jgi:hypothetical protein
MGEPQRKRGSGQDDYITENGVFFPYLCCGTLRHKTEVRGARIERSLFLGFFLVLVLLLLLVSSSSDPYSEASDSSSATSRE